MSHKANNRLMFSHLRVIYCKLMTKCNLCLLLAKFLNWKIPVYSVLLVSLAPFKIFYFLWKFSNLILLHKIKRDLIIWLKRKKIFNFFGSSFMPFRDEFLFSAFWETHFVRGWPKLWLPSHYAVFKLWFFEAECWIFSVFIWWWKLSVPNRVTVSEFMTDFLILGLELRTWCFWEAACCFLKTCFCSCFHCMSSLTFNLSSPCSLYLRRSL